MLTAGAGTYPWCAAQAFKPGDLMDGIPLAGLQITAKSLWPDGSVKIGILAGVLTAAGTSSSVTLARGEPPLTAWLTTADLKATGIAANIDAGTFGSAAWAASSSDWDSPFITWAEGPLMSSWIYRKQIGSDAHLTAWMEVRLFDVSGTKHVEVLPWVENGYLSVASPNGKAETYSFTLGGTSRFSAALPMYHHTRVPLISGSTLSYWLGTDKTVTPKHDATYLAQTGLVQPYMSSVARTYPALPSNGGVSSSYTPGEVFQSGTNTVHPTVMGAAGGSDSIGAQPAWEAIALVDSSALGFTQMLRESFRFGHYQIHYRDESTNRPIKFSTRSGVQIRPGDALANVGDIEDQGLTYTPVIAGGKTPTPDASPRNFWKTSHQPAAPLLAYITTGRFWFMEECQHISAVNFLLSGATRGGTQYLYCTPSITPTRMQLRQAAWTFRNLAIAACVTPDDDALKADFDASVDYNIEQYHTKYVAQTNNPFGLIENVGNGTSGGNQAWQFDFWTASWARAIAFRVGSTKAKREKARAFFDWTAQATVGRAGGFGATEYPYRWATTSTDGASSFVCPGSNPGSYASAYTDGTYPDYATGTGPWWTSWGAFWTRRIVTDLGWAGGKVDGALAGPIEATGWWGVFNEALTACASHGVTGAAAGLARLQGNSDWSGWFLLGAASGGAYYDQRPTNATTTVALAAENFTDYRPAVGNIANVNLNGVAEADFDTAFGSLNDGAKRWWLGYGFAPGLKAWTSMVTSYSGTTWAPEYGNLGGMVVHGGGHGGNIGQFSYVFDFESLKWRQVGAPRNLPPDFDWAGYLSPPSSTKTNAAGPSDSRDPDWMDYLWNGSYVAFSDHEYVQNGYVSPAEGGGRLGSLYLPQATFSQDPGVADPFTGIAFQHRPHLFDLATGKVTRATSATLGTWNGYSATLTIKDTTRNRLWFFPNSTPACSYLDLSSGPPYTRVTHTIQKASGGNATWFSANNSAGLYVPEADAIVVFSPTRQNEGNPATADGPLTLWVYTMGTGVPVDRETWTDPSVPTQNMAHGGFIVGCAWCPWVGANGAFYLYEGFGATYCYVLTPSSRNFATCTWTWTRESFGGATPVYKSAVNLSDAQRLAPQGKFVPVPGLQCIALHDGPDTTGMCADGVTRDAIVQLFRPPGTPI